MLIQNIGSAASATGFTGNSGPAPIAASGTPVAPNELPQVAVKAASAPPSDAQLKSAVDSINSSLKQSNTNVQFSIDQSTKQAVIKVTDSITGQIITQFPSKEAMAVSQMIEQSQHGALIKQQA